MRGSENPMTEGDIQSEASKLGLNLSPEDIEFLMQKQEKLRDVLTDVNDLYTTG
jgi:hypothetical protein